MNGSLRRPARRVGLVAGAIACLVLSMPMSAMAGWTKQGVTDGWFLWYPAVAAEADDDLDVIYARLGSDPGLFFATNSGGSWSSTRVSSGDHWAPDVVIDGAGHLHVAYASSGSDTGIHYLTNAGGGWSDTRVSTEAEVDRPSIALDGSGHAQIVYAVHGADPGLYHVSDETGGWVRTRLMATPQQWSPDLAIDAAGTLHVVSARFTPEAPGLFYMTRTAGTWSIPTHITNAYDDWPSIVVDAGGNVSMAFQRFGLQPSEPNKGQLFTAFTSAGTWYFERVTGGYQEGFFIGPPDVKLVTGGVGGDALHIMVRERSTDPAGGQAIFHYVKAMGLLGFDNPPLYTPGAVVNETTMAILSNGSYRVAYGSYGGESAGIFLSGPNSAEIVATSSDDVDPTILSAADGTRHLTFDRANATFSERGIHYGDDAGGWSFERTQIGPSLSDVPGGDTDLGLAGDGSVRILTKAPSVTHMTNESATWDAQSLGSGISEGGAVVDGAGVSHVAITTDGGLFLRYATNSGATWTQADLWHPLYTGDTVGTPAIVVDGSGRRTILFGYSTPTFTPGLFFMSAPPGGAWPAGPTRLASGDIAGIDVVADASNKLHVAWLDGGANPGVYYATNSTGTWVRTRLTRSTADTVPSVALDTSGKAYVAFSRAYWADVPGIYLATNGTGVWQTIRLSEDAYSGRVSLDIGPDGLADIAYVNSVDGVSILAQDNTASTSGVKAALRGAVAKDRPTVRADEPKSSSAPSSADAGQPDRHVPAP
jgi:hypothetical protein